MNPGTPDTISDLLRQVADDSQAAFSRLLRLYGQRIFSQAMAYTKSVELAEEMVQDIFMKVWEERAELIKLDNFENWLFIVAKNHVIKAMQKRINQPLEATVNGEMVAGLGNTEFTDPQQQTEYNQSYRLLMRAIDLLPEKRKRVFYMSRFENKSQVEIAEELGIHKDTVYQYIVMSLSFLKDYLEKHTGDAILVIILLRGLP
ncbi:MAG: sigma-70 family RNA polymerase sigma factor [Bacteroidota bacterium]